MSDQRVHLSMRDVDRSIDRIEAALVVLALGPEEVEHARMDYREHIDRQVFDDLGNRSNALEAILDERLRAGYMWREAQRKQKASDG